MNVKIKQNQNPGMWYSNLENEVLEIEEQDAFKLKGHNLFILKSDCDIVSQTIKSESVTVQNSDKEWIPNVGEWAVYTGFATRSTKLRKINSVDGDYLEFDHIDGEVVSNDKEYYRKALPHEIPVERKLIGTYEGFLIYEDTKAWFVDILNLKIKHPDGFELETWPIEDDTNDESKVYITEKEANARLKEEVIKAANNRKYTLSEMKAIHYSELLAIQLVEKERGVVYLNEI